MSKNQVVIIEDEFFVASHLKDLVVDFGYEVVGVYYSGEDFLEQTDWQFDTAIIDIFLSEELSGLDIAEKIKEKNKPFIFLTANQDTDTLKKAARLEPKAYITKPFKINDISAALEIISYSLPNKIEITGANGKTYINPSDIVFVKSDGVYIEIQTHEKSIIQRKLLKDIIDELPNNFVRVHRSYLVNTNYIEQRQPHQVTVKGQKIPVSRNFKENLI